MSSKRTAQVKGKQSIIKCHLSIDDVTLGHTDDCQEPEHMQHLKYAQQQVVCVVDWSHADNRRRLKQRASHNSESK